jgi:hypothetical protein
MTIRSWAVLTAVLSLVASSVAATAVGAQVTRPTARFTPIARSSSDSTRLVGLDGVPVRAEAVRMPANPGGIVVVRVPIPAEIRTQLRRDPENGFYAVRSVGAVRLLGATSGTVAATRDAVIVSLNLGRRQPAGVSAVARVDFRAGAVAIEVPVEIDVSTIGSVSLQLADREVVAPQGRWSVLRLRVLNAGNGSETLLIGAQPVAGWRVESRASVTIPSGGVADATVRFWVPPAASTGLTILRVVARRGRDVVAEGQARIEVKSVARERSAGLLVELSSTGVSSPSTTPAMGYGFSVSGNLTDSTQIDARASMGSSDDPSASFALARAGLLSLPPSVNIQSPRFAVSAGVLNTVLHDPGGAYASGLGGSGSFRAGAWRFGGFGGRPLGISRSGSLTAGDGRLTGASLDRRSLGGHLGLEALLLENRQLGQALQSVTLHGTELRVAGGELTVSVAARRFADTIGVSSYTAAPGLDPGRAPLRYDQSVRFGASTIYRVQRPNTSFDLRVLHAPGGSSSFSRSGDDISGNLSRRIDRHFSLGGGGWYQGDRGSLIGRVAASGWFFTPSVATASGAARLSLEGRGSNFLARTGTVAYRNDEALGGANLELRRQMLFVRVRMSGGSAVRSIGIDSLTTTPVRGNRSEQLATLGLSGSRGTLEVSWTSMAIGGSMLNVPPQQALALRANGVRLFTFAGQSVTVSAEGQRLASGAAYPATWTLHGELAMPLPGGMTFTASADRNPYLSMATTNGSPNVYSLRVDQRLHTRRFSLERARTRKLFVDDNSNGRLDRGEETLAGVAMQCGRDALTTDAQGTFSCIPTELAVIDVRTLPMGIVPPSRDAARRGDVALFRVAPIAVQLRLPTSDSLRLPPSEVAKAFVSVRDEAGTRWYARPTSGSAFVFDALPIGRYTLEIEQGGMTELLAFAGAARDVWVTREPQSAPIGVDVRGRQTRIKVIGAPSTGAGQSPATTVVPPAAQPPSANRRPVGGGR